MKSISYQEFCKKSKYGNLVALHTTVPADLDTPVSCFLKLSDDEPNAFLLESAEQADQVGRYSIIGYKPFEIYFERNGRIIVESNHRKKDLGHSKELLNRLKEKLSEDRLANPDDIPGFSGGFVGFFSYENVVHFEKINLNKLPGVIMPKAIFYLVRDFIVFDHFRKTMTVVKIIPAPTSSALKKSYQREMSGLNRTVRKLSLPLNKISRNPSKPVLMRSNMTPQKFYAKVKKIKEYIRAGDCIQVVLSQRFSMKAPKHDFQIYRALRSVNPSPYMFYFRCGKHRLIGSSPELLVRNQGRRAEVRPIAGTRPRGKNDAEDQQYIQSLRRSVKEMAEHLMLVDLGRNDLGRVCEYRSVKVAQFARIEKYSHVMHLVSDVEGKLRSGKDRFDLLRAAFPAGTVSGAPKIRAMQIINELEEQERGPYAGCLGFLSYQDTMEMCITIRTLVLSDGQLYLQAGAGIVKDSNPVKEYQETVNKAKALMTAIQNQGGY